MVELERPTLLTEILRFYKNDLGYAIDDVTRLLFANNNEVSSSAQPNHERFKRKSIMRFGRWMLRHVRESYGPL